MNRICITAAACLWATTLAAESIRIEGAYVPLAPPGVMSHAAYMTLENGGEEKRSLVGVAAVGYAMAHLHKSEHQDGVATMSMIHQLDIDPGQTVSFEPGGLHIMLMRPEGKGELGGEVALTLTFANGEELPVTATIRARDSGS